MYISDIVSDFYNVLIGNQVLLLVNHDIDGLCTCKMLQWLFQSEEVLYTLVPVQTISDMKSAFKEFLQETKYVVLVNCGGSIDLVDVLEPEEDVVIFVLDSHRPTDLCNIYSSSQIRILSLPGEDEEIPAFKDVFASDNESEDESEEEEEDNQSDESGENRRAKRLKLAEDVILKRRHKREWEERKNKILFEYSQFTYYGKCSSVIIHELLWRISKGNLELLWFAIVGLTSYLISGDSTHEMYFEDMQILKKHVDELTGKFKLYMTNQGQDASQTNRNNAATTCIYSEMDMNLALYRHWTVEASIKHSMCTAVHLKLWTKRGEQKLHQILAEMGLPISQSKQLFKSMDMTLRQKFHEMMTKVADTHNMSNLTFPSFLLQMGFKRRYYASDYIYALMSLMNPANREKSPTDCFLECIDCFGRTKKDLIETGLEDSKKLLTTLFRQVQMCLDMKQVMSAGTFLYFIIQEGMVEADFYSHPHTLIMLARFMLKAYVQVGTKRRQAKFPLIASAPCDLSSCLVVGIPPVTEFTNRNFFGKAFEQAAAEINCPIEMDYFESSIVKIKTENRSAFFDSLTALLA